MLVTRDRWLARAAESEPLVERLLREPDRLAVVRAQGRKLVRVSFGEILERGRALAGGLRRRGIGPGDRVFVLVEPGEDLVIVLVALLLAGALPVLVDPGLGISRMLSCVADAQVDAVVSVRRARVLAWLRPRAFSAVKLWATTDGWAPGTVRLADLFAEPPSEVPQRDSEATCLIAFTSGSTGPAKGVELTRANLEATFECFRVLLGDQRPGEMDLIALPALSLVGVFLGRTSLVPQLDFAHLGRVDPRHLAAYFNRFPVTASYLSPILCLKLADYGASSGLQLARVRVMLTGGAPIANRVAIGLRRVLCAGEFFTPYGATEVLPATLIGAREIEEETAAASARGKGVCVGRPLPGTSLAIVDPDRQAESWDAGLELPRGAVGEIAVSGPQVSPRYYRREAETRTAKIAGEDGRLWHRMGDVGYLDGSGRLWFCGRKKHRIVLRDGVLYPVAVEGLFAELPFVFRSALVGVASSRGDVVPVLVVEPRSKPRRGQAQAWSAEIQRVAREHDVRLAAVLFHPKPFPTDRRHNSKIERLELAEWARARLRKRRVGAI